VARKGTYHEEDVRLIDKKEVPMSTRLNLKKHPFWYISRPAILYRVAGDRDQILPRVGISGAAAATVPGVPRAAIQSMLLSPATATTSSALFSLLKIEDARRRCLSTPGEDSDPQTAPFLARSFGVAEHSRAHFQRPWPDIARAPSRPVPSPCLSKGFQDAPSPRCPSATNVRNCFAAVRSTLISAGRRHHAVPFPAKPAWPCC